jgi:hypothetical protein
MATLNSPGVAVTVVDESFYTPAAPGTVPLIVVASQENKQNGAGTGIAPGTLKSNAGQVYLLTSQKDLSDNFGIPYFQTDAENNPVHAGELNEYGLQAAYSYLGVSNRAYVVRADIDTSQLVATPTAPAGAPIDGTFWVDTADTNYGIFVWNNTTQQFVNAIPRVITDYTLLSGVTLSGTTVLSFTGILPSVGSNGDFAVVAVTTDVTIWNKSNGVWNELGTTAWSGDQTLTFNGYIDNNPSPATLSNVNITGNAGTFTSSASTFAVGQQITISGTISNSNTPVTSVTASSTAGTFTVPSGAFQVGQQIVVSGTASTSTLSNVLSTGLTGTFSCSSTTLAVGQPVTFTGSNTSTTLTGSVTVATGGNFTMGSASATTLQIGQTITISGTLSGVTITGYSNPTTYYIIATNGTTTFQLSATSGGPNITTTAGTLTGATIVAGAATISGYSSPATYYITATNGTTTFTLSSTLGGNAITTTVGAITAGVVAGSGSIAGYSNPTTYYITATNGTTTFTLSSSFGGLAVTTTNGLFVGYTFSLQAPSITGYTNPKTYYVISTNGSTTFTLSAVSNGSAITTVGGAPSGLTFTAAGVPGSGNQLHVVGSVFGGSIMVGETVTWNNGANSATITGGSGSLWTLSASSLTGSLGSPVAMGISYIDLELQLSPHTQVPQWQASTANPNGTPSGSVWIKTTYPNLGANWVVKKYSASTKAWAQISSNLYPDNHTALYSLDPTGGGINLALGTVYVRYFQDPTTSAVQFLVYARQAVGATSITLNILPTSGAISFGMKETLPGAASASASESNLINISGITAVTSPVTTGNAIGNAIGAAGFQYITASVNQTTGAVTITHKNGGDISIQNMVGINFNDFASTNVAHSPLYPADNTRLVGSLWTSTVSGVGLFALSPTAPTTLPADGTLWYDSNIDADILVHNGYTWVGLQFMGNGTSTHSSPYLGVTDANGPIISATQPTARPDGQPAFVTGDLWINTSGDLDMYPQINRYNANTKQWVPIDTADQTTPNGILFADARWTTNGASSTPGTIAALLTSNFLDFDAPDPALYPQGMLLWNLRRSGFNVKKYHANYVNTTGINYRYNLPSGDNMSTYFPDRWVSAAANQNDGAGSFGRIAQRQVVLQALGALLQANQQIRDEESRVFNLIATPGYPEVIGDMVTLNYDRGISAFVVADAPARLTPDATTLSNWGNNNGGALVDGDSGLVTFDDYLGVFYPWGYSTDLIGNNIVVPPSHMMLRTIALSDNVSYPWFAPAGVRRGGITNATAVGYVDAITGEFQSVAFNTGQRDTLASIKVNALTYLRGVGLVNYGQYTRASVASSLDRINVARLVIYLRQQFNALAKPYVFEPNDKITRDSIKGQAESLLLELVGQRALYDYVVVCDTTNNTPSRIDRNELYLDIAVEPVKSVEFIYIPIRLENTGAIKALGL